MNVRAVEVVVIGGGAIGAATAYFLARNKVRTALVERGGIASGASGRCDGNVLVQDKIPGYDSDLTRKSQLLFPQVAEELDYDIGWVQRGSLTVFESEAEMEIGRRFCLELADTGLPVRILDREQVHRDESALAPDVAGGLECDCDGALNPMALTQGLILGARRLGAEVWTGAGVTAVELNRAGAVEKVKTTRGDLAAPRVVDAAGVWAPEIGSLVGLNIPILPRQGQLLVTERCPRVSRRKVMEFGYLAAKFSKEDYRRQVDPDMERFGAALVLEPTEAGNYLIGSSRRFSGRDVKTALPVLRAMARRAVRFFPMLARVNVIRSYAGLRPFTPDHLPIISPTPVKGFYVNAGHEGDGIGLSLISGLLMSQLILERPTEMDVRPLALDRFTPATQRDH